VLESASKEALASPRLFSRSEIVNVLGFFPDSPLNTYRSPESAVSP
jgi:hypothetical protein